MSHPQSSSPWFTPVSLFRRWFTPGQPTRTARKRRGTRPCLEVLEDRVVPSLTLVVTDPGDEVDLDGVVTLREALQAANTNTTVFDAFHDGSSGTDSIIFAFDFVAHPTITLGGTELTITDSVTITGPGADLLTISGNHASRIFYIGDQSVFVIINVEISGLTLTGGNATGADYIDSSGGAILNEEALTLTDCTLSGNSAVGLGSSAVGLGGGICNNFGGTVMVISSTLSDNSAVGGDGSAGWGGGIHNQDGTVMVTSSTLSGNSASGLGGGISNSSGMLTVTSSTLSGNSAATGGGIYNDGTGSTVTSSTLSGNSAATGGGIYNGDILTVTSSTLSGNSATGYGGGIFNGYDVTVTSSTLSGNSAEFGGGIFNANLWVTLYNTIVANSLEGDDVQNYYTLTGSYNLIETPVTGPGTNSLTYTIMADPNLGPLQDNGGPTWTHALLMVPFISPAINAGDPDFDGDDFDPLLLTDQRGHPRVDGGRIDIGAFEADLTPPSISAPPSLTVGTDPGEATATVAPGWADASDNGGEVSVTYTRSDDGDALLTAPYPVGTTTITWTAMDAAGNSASATQIVRVEDREAPTVIVLNMTVGTDPGLATATVDPGLPEANDNVGVVSLTGVRDDGWALDAPYPVGMTRITWTATDAAGNSATVEQWITVLTPVQLIEQLADDMETLVLAGTVPEGLLSKLNRALAALERENDTAARNLLEAAILQLEGLVRAGQVEEPLAESLIEELEAVLASI